MHKSYYVKLAYFVNNFVKPLSLFKLHGSIFNTLVYEFLPHVLKFRVKSNYAIGDYFIEKKDSVSEEFQLKRLHDEVVPDFLSGITNKTRSYVEDDYYLVLFDHFKNNLEQSEILIVVGYGFQDPGINDYIENHFLMKHKKMIVIDPSKPNSKLLEKYNVHHINTGITQVSKDTYQEILSQFNRCI